MENKMSYETMRREYFERYDRPEYANDEESQNVLDLLRAADKLSSAAQAEFAQGFSFEFAITGEMYLGGRKAAAYNYPHLIAEAEAAGIKIITR